VACCTAVGHACEEAPTPRSASLLRHDGGGARCGASGAGAPAPAPESLPPLPPRLPPAFSSPLFFVCAARARPSCVRAAAGAGPPADAAAPGGGGCWPASRLCPAPRSRRRRSRLARPQVKRGRRRPRDVGGAPPPSDPARRCPPWLWTARADSSGARPPLHPHAARRHAPTLPRASDKLARVTALERGFVLIRFIGAARPCRPRQPGRRRHHPCPCAPAPARPPPALGLSRTARAFLLVGAAGPDLCASITRRDAGLPRGAQRANRLLNAIPRFTTRPPPTLPPAFGRARPRQRDREAPNPPAPRGSKEGTRSRSGSGAAAPGGQAGRGGAAFRRSRPFAAAPPPPGAAAGTAAARSSPSRTPTRPRRPLRASPGPPAPFPGSARRRGAATRGRDGRAARRPRGWRRPAAGAPGAHRRGRRRRGRRGGARARPPARAAARDRRRQGARALGRRGRCRRLGHRRQPRGRQLGRRPRGPPRQARAQHLRLVDGAAALHAAGAHVVCDLPGAV
jgi:hypothetical protein